MGTKEQFRAQDSWGVRDGGAEKVAKKKRAAKQRSKFNDGNFDRYWFFYSFPEMGKHPSLTLSESSPTSAHRGRTNFPLLLNSC